jgi:hypothetical protein
MIDKHLMNKIERINLDDYIQTGEGGTALTYTSKDGKTLAKLYNLGFEADRARDIFLPAYLGTTDPQRIEEATRRICPFVATKVPFMLCIANHLDLIPKTLQRLVRLLD